MPVWRDAPVGVVPEGTAWALFCEDQFDNRYRFLDKGARPDVFHPGDDLSAFVWLRVWQFADGEQQSYD